MVANREVRDWLLAFTFGATYFSSVVIVVGGAWAYMWGPTTLLIPLLNVVVGAFLAFIVVGRKIARLSLELDALTVPELLAKIHGSSVLQRVFGIVTSAGLTLYAATVISAVSAMVGTVFHVDLRLAAFIIAGVMALYIALGGMYSVVWTDALQGVVMSSAIAVVALLALGRVGGLAGLEHVEPLKPAPITLIVDLALLTSIAVWGLPQLLNRFYTVESPKVVKRATGLATFFAFIVSFGSFLTGLAARQLVAGIPPMKAVPTLSLELLGEVGAAVFAAAVLAAAMSTADSIALTVASAFVYDVLGVRSTRTVRAASFLAMLVAAAIAVATLSLPKNLAEAVTAIFKTGWTLTAGAFLVPVLATLYDKKVGKTPILAASIAGMLVSIFFGLAKALRIALPTTITTLSFTITILASLAVYVVARMAAMLRK